MKNGLALILFFLGAVSVCRSTTSHDVSDGLSAMANMSSGRQLAARRDRHCNPNNLAPNLPHGPYLCGFPNQNMYNAAAVGVLDAYKLALAALRVLDRCGQSGEEASLTRYFDIGTPEVREVVFRVFNWIVGPDGFGAPMILDPEGYDLEIWYNQGSPDNLIFEHPSSCAIDGLGGYMNSFMTEVRRAWIVLCARTFSDQKPTLDDVRCEDLDDVASQKMVTVGSVILHEFMHWSRFTRTYVGFDILDWPWPQEDSDDPPTDPDPPTGYGPYHAQILQEELLGAIKNADNYMWFALEAWFSEKCEREFGEQFEHDERNDHPADNNQISG